MSISVIDRAEHIVKLARERRMTLATVESCTAGALANLLSRAEGASDALHGGFIVYTKPNKIAAVGVPAKLLQEQGGLQRCPASIVVAITGVAGPEPDEDGNPVGLVFCAAAARDGRTRGARLELGKADKEEICCKAMFAALSLVEDLLVAHLP